MSERGQALLLVVGLLWLGMLAAMLAGGVASALGARGDRQRAADLAALAAARTMRENYDRLFEPRRIADVPNPRWLGRSEYSPCSAMPYGPPVLNDRP